MKVCMYEYSSGNTYRERQEDRETIIVRNYGKHTQQVILSFGVVLNGMIEQPMYDMVLTSRQTRGFDRSVYGLLRFSRPVW